MLKHRQATGEIVVVLPGVFGYAAVAETFVQRCLAATMWAGPDSGLSHESCGTLLRLDGCKDRGIIHVASSRRRSKIPSGIALHIARLEPVDRAVHLGIPITSVAKTLMDLGTVLPFDELELALEYALRRGYISLARMRLYLKTFGGKGKHGTLAIQRLMDDRPKGTPATGSVLEVQTLQFLRRHRFPPADRQVAIKDGGHFICRVDFCYPDRDLLIEADSYEFHSGKQKWLDDIDKRNALPRLGWRLVIVTDDALKNHPKELEQAIRAYFSPGSHLWVQKR